jgi:hypothetical protein
MLKREKQVFLPRKPECFSKQKKIFLFILKTSYAISSVAFWSHRNSRMADNMHCRLARDKLGLKNWANNVTFLNGSIFVIFVILERF